MLPRSAIPDALAALQATTLFHPTGVDGVYARTGAYEGVVEALAALISRHRAGRAPRCCASRR